MIQHDQLFNDFLSSLRNNSERKTYNIHKKSVKRCKASHMSKLKGAVQYISSHSQNDGLNNLNMHW